MGKAVKEGNITTIQRDEIQRKLTHLLDKEYKNNTQGKHIEKKRFELVLLFFKIVLIHFIPLIFWSLERDWLHKSINSESRKL